MTISPPPNPLHPAVPGLLREAQSGQLNRREFLSRATALGLAVPAAYQLIGGPALAQQAAPLSEGGILRCAMDVKPLVDPRLSDWPQIANIYRGWLEYLVQYNGDGSFEGRLLTHWDVNEDASIYHLHLRPDVYWNNGDGFTAADVIANFRRWCDGRVAGNSMAPRFAGLIDPTSLQLREGAVEQVDALTIRLSLRQSDATLVASLSDYPAAVLHSSYEDGSDPSTNPIGTGPWLPAEITPGKRAILRRNEQHVWWGGRPALQEIHYIDYGTDPAAMVALANRDQIDCTYETTSEFIPALGRLGWGRLMVDTAATIVIRMNSLSGPEFTDRSLRQAIQCAVDPAVVLEIGYGGHGSLAENHHACPLHPDYALLPPQEIRPEALRPALAAVGFADHEFELVSIDDSWEAASADAVAVQLRDAGMKVARRVISGAAFWPEWRSFAFSATSWNHRPLAVQTMALAYTSNAVWNETGMANAEFDAAVAQAMGLADAEARREVMAKLQRILRDEGHIIQPFWRQLYRHRRPGVQIDIHPSFEHHHYKWSIDPALQNIKTQP